MQPFPISLPTCLDCFIGDRLLVDAPIALTEQADLFGTLSLLAQGQGGAPGGGFLQLMPLVAIAMLAYFLFFVPQRNKERKYQEMVAGLKENDHVITNGGIYGVVTNVQREQQKVTLRIDDSTGAKIRVGIWAIAEVENHDKGSKSSS